MAGGPKGAILGAGSVGCFIGGSWASAGVPVTFIGRQKLARDVDQWGLTLTDYAGWQARLAQGDVDYRSGPEGLEEAEIIVLTVKSGEIRSPMPGTSPTIGSSPIRHEVPGTRKAESSSCATLRSGIVRVTR